MSRRGAGSGVYKLICGLSGFLGRLHAQTCFQALANSPFSSTGYALGKQRRLQPPFTLPFVLGRLLIVMQTVVSDRFAYRCTCVANEVANERIIAQISSYRHTVHCNATGIDSRNIQTFSML